MKPLDGVRVVDLTRLLSGPFATQILADLGAEVIKVEPPGGDKARQNGPFVDGQSTYFASLNRGKKSVVLNLKREAAREVFRRLVKAADVVVENFRPGVMERLGLGFRELRDINRNLVYVACSGFGQEGPRREHPALDVVIQAMAGTMSITGPEDGEPVRVGFSVGDLGGGLYTAVAVLAGLQSRQHGAGGLYLDVSMLDAQVALLENAFVRYFATGEVPRPTGTRHPVLAPFQAFATADRPIVIAVSTEQHWESLLEALELTDLKSRPEFADAAARRAHHADLAATLERRLRERTADEWLSRLMARHVPAGPVHRISDTAQDPQVALRHVFRTVEVDGTPFRVAGPPYHINGAPVPVAGHVPALGEHSRAVLTELGYSDAEIVALMTEGSVE
jgi:CoA:oxalate CoA-transferase